MIIVATPQASMPAVDLLVDAMPAGTATVRIWRTFAGQRTALRDADGAGTGGSVSRPYTDWEVPLKVPTAYQVYAYSSAGAVLGSAQSAAVTVDASSPWISDPLAPGRACAVVLVNESLQEITHDVQGDVATVTESGLPVAVPGEIAVGSSVPLRFAAHTALDGQMVRAVLSGKIFLLRCLPEMYANIPALSYIAFQSYTDVKISRVDRDHDHIALTGQVVAPPLSVVVLSPRTYGDLRDEASTYGDVQGLYPTYLDVLRGSA